MSLDSLIGFLSPSWAGRRAESRMRLRRLEFAERLQAKAFALSGDGGSSYAGASGRRSMATWATSSADADSDLLPELPALRDRSQDLYRNSPAGRGAIKRLATGAIGSGLAMRSIIDRTVLGMTEDQAQEWEDAAEREFGLWAKSRECDFTRRMTFNETQMLAFVSQSLRGDCFALLFWKARPGVPYDLRVQLVEADRVCNPNDLPDDDTVAGGVERDPDGVPVAIHVRTVHPGNRIMTAIPKWARIPIYGETTGRRQVLHLMQFERIDQSRGEPLLAPVIETLKQLTRYSEAELSAAVVNSFLAVFFKHPMEGVNPNTGMEISYTDDQKRKWEERAVELGSGTIIDGAPGEELQTVTANRPNAQYDPFFVACLKQIGMAISVPFEVLLQHFSSSYSASRAALLEFAKFIKTVRAWFVSNYCQPVYEEFLTEAVIKGRLDAPGFLDDPVIRAAYCQADWMGPGAGMIDPVKEVEASWKKVVYGFSTFGRETAEITGSDFEQTTYKRAEEFGLLQKFAPLLEVFRSVLGGGSPPPPQPEPDKDEGDADDAA